MAVLNRDDVDFVDDPDTAARLYLELSAQLSNPSLTHGQVTETKAAIKKLAAAWPEAADRAATASEHDLGGLNQSLKRTRQAHRQDRGVDARSAAAARRKQNAPTSGPSRATSSRAGAGRATSSRAAGGRARRAGARVIGEAAGYATPAGELLVKVLGASIAFAVLYALVTNADSSKPGQSAIELFTGSVNTALNVLIRPVDPLGGTAAATAANAQAAGAPRAHGGRSRSVGRAITKAARKKTSGPARRTHTRPTSEVKW